MCAAMVSGFFCFLTILLGVCFSNFFASIKHLAIAAFTRHIVRMRDWTNQNRKRYEK